METYYTSNNGFGKTIIFVYEKDDLYKVIKTLEFISKLLCSKIDYDVDFDENEISVSVADYYEFTKKTIWSLRSRCIKEINKWTFYLKTLKNTRELQTTN